jgi:hypothetical protein
VAGKKKTETSVWMAGVLIKIGTKHLPNTNLECYHYVNLLTITFGHMNVQRTQIWRAENFNVITCFTDSFLEDKLEKIVKNLFTHRGENLKAQGGHF